MFISIHFSKITIVVYICTFFIYLQDVNMDIVEENIYRCELCDYNSSQKGNLKRHMEAVHEGKKPFKCSACDYKCSEKGSLKRHVLLLHEGKKQNSTALQNEGLDKSKEIEESISLVDNDIFYYQFCRIGIFMSVHYF